MSVLTNLNYKEYPECMFAMLAAFLPESEGDVLRTVAGHVSFKSVDDYGRTCRNGLFHSFNDEPVVYHGFIYCWYKNGKLHREGDLPAVINTETHAKAWYRNGKYHRDGDLPAVVNDNYTEWWVNGERHRDGDQPAHIHGNIVSWYRNGKLHRDKNQPAHIHGYRREWYTNGVWLRECYQFN